MTTYTTTATATSATGNLITVASTTNMFLGLPITFTGTEFGGITADYTYYILTIDYANSKITVSPLPAGVATTLTTATGSMTVSFTSGGQQMIDTDPPGTSLNTAFEYINTNFDQVFAAGPVGTNVQIVGNKIQTLNTNGDLTLAPNGTGKVIANVDILPNINYVRSLGNINRRWNSVYAQTLDVSSEVDFSGDVTIGGNLTVTGDIIEMGNIVTDAKTIQLANTANTANAANGSGITVGASDNIATMLYNSTSNTWVTNIGANITGNVTASYFIGNGSQLTGITSYANANAVAYGQAGWAGNIIPATSNVYSLGNSTNQWNDLYISNATIYMNNIPISLTAGNVLTVNGANVVTSTAGGNIDVNNIVSNSNIAIDTSAERVTVSVGLSDWVFDETGVLTAPGEIETVGNISAGYFLGNGSQLTGLVDIGNLDIVGTDISIAAGATETLINISPDAEGWAYLQLPNNATANAYNTRLHNDAGNVEIGTGDFSTGSSSYEWVFDTTGNLTVPRDIIFDGGSIFQVPDEDLKIIVQDNEDDGWALQLEVRDGTDVHSRIDQQRDSVQIGVGLTTGPAYYWQFNDSGVLNLPGDVWGTYGGNLSILARGITDSSFVELATQDNTDTKRSNVTVTRDNVTVTTSSGAYNWTFDVNGDLIVPGGNTTIYTPNAVGNVAGNSISIVGGAADQTNYYTTAGGNVNITGGLGAFNDGGGGGPGGNVNLTAGLSADPAGVAGNINITAGSGTMVFDYNGNLTVSGSILTDNIRTIEGAVHVGQGAGLTNQGLYGIAVGRFAGSQDQGAAGLAIGQLAGSNTQGQQAIALGLYAAANTQSANAVAIGTFAGQTTQGTSAIAIGREAGNSSQGVLSVAIGTWAGNISQGGYSVAIGPSAGSNTQGENSVAIGVSAAREAQGTAAIAIGQGSGTISQGAQGIAIGDQAGQQSQAANAIAIGTYAGYESAGISSISIGTGAGYYIANNAIVINATGANLDGNTANTFTVAPVRNDVSNIGQVMFYNTTSKEVTYGNTISVAGNITASATVSGQTLVSTQSAANEGGEITLALPSSGSTLSGNIIIDSYQDWVRLFEGGGNSRGLYVDIPNVSTSGQYAIGYRDVPQIALSGNVTANSITAGKHFYSTTAGNLQVTIPDNANVAFPTGATITVVVNAAGNVIIAQGTGVSLYMAGSSTTGNRAVGAYGLASIMKVATDTWVISGTGVY